MGTKKAAIQTKSKPLSWEPGEDPQAFTDALMADLEISEEEVGRYLFDVYSRHASPEEAMHNLRMQFPHLPTFELTAADRAEQKIEEAEAALDKGRKAQAKRLIQKAFELDPQCVEAYLLQYEMLPETTPFQDALAVLQQALHAAKLSIGTDDDFNDNIGQFWGWAVTRPYMTVLERMAWLCWQAPDRPNEAITHAQEMLRLNPNDNQGIRYALLYWLMAQKRWDEAVALWQAYQDDASIWWVYGKYFLTAHRNGVTAKSSKKDFETALAYNPFVIAIFMADTPEMLYQMKQPYYAPGDPSEAAQFVETLMGAYHHHALDERTTEPPGFVVLFEQLNQISPRQLDKHLRKATSQLFQSEVDS